MVILSDLPLLGDVILQLALDLLGVEHAAEGGRLRDPAAGEVHAAAIAVDLLAEQPEQLLDILVLHDRIDHGAAERVDAVEHLLLVARDDGKGVAQDLAEIHRGGERDDRHVCLPGQPDR